MQRDKLYLVLGAAVLVTGVAAFLAGRMINSGVNPLGLFGLAGNGRVIVTDILPAKELPQTRRQIEGLFVERQDQIIYIQGSQPNSYAGGVEVGSPADVANGPKVEVVISAGTKIYRDTTQLPTRRPTPENNPPIQQTVEPGTLDDLNPSQSLVMAWGPRSGERIHAEVLVYSNPVRIQEP